MDNDKMTIPDAFKLVLFITIFLTLIYSIGEYSNQRSMSKDIENGIIRLDSGMYSCKLLKGGK